ncbi:MAG: 2'-5' RNA ligase family protein [Anaerolineae bacterium]|nr:2'-5' RNA ligase family protein [Anaerolineae bacterium]
MFPQASVGRDDLVRHVQKVAADQDRIPFVIRRAEAVRDVLSDNSYLFLVLDEGHNEMIDLHDALYTGVMAAELRADVPFIPHITVGYTADADDCQRAADAINATAFELRGVMDRLDLVELKEADGRTVAQILLG